MSYTKNLTIRDLMNSIPSTQRIQEFLEEGISTQNPMMAIPAMEELLRRGDLDIVMDILERIFYSEEEGIIKNSSFAVLLASAMAEADGRTCAFVRAYGQSLLKGVWLSPVKWFVTRREELFKTRRSGATHQACDWVKKCTLLSASGDTWDQAREIAAEIDARNADADKPDSRSEESQLRFLSGPDQIKAGVDAAKNRNYVPDSTTAMSDEYRRGYRDGAKATLDSTLP